MMSTVTISESAIPVTDNPFHPDNQQIHFVPKKDERPHDLPLRSKSEEDDEVSVESIFIQIFYIINFIFIGS